MQTIKVNNEVMVHRKELEKLLFSKMKNGNRFAMVERYDKNSVSLGFFIVKYHGMAKETIVFQSDYFYSAAHHFHCIMIGTAQA